MFLYKTLVIIILAINSAHSARILAIIPTPSFSHQIAFREIWRNLSLRGHQLTLITTDPINDPTLVNLTEIDVSFSYKRLATERQKIAVAAQQGVVQFAFELFRQCANLYEEQFSYEPIRSLLNNKSEHFDLVIGELMHVITFGFADRFKCPLIGASSLDGYSISYSSIGSPTHPILYPDVSAPFHGSNPSFIDRLRNANNYFLEMFVIPYYVNRLIEPIGKKHFGAHYSVYDSMKGLDLVILNKSPILQTVRPTVPAVVYFGGATHLATPKVIPKVRFNF